MGVKLGFVTNIIQKERRVERKDIKGKGAVIHTHLHIGFLVMVVVWTNYRFSLCSDKITQSVVLILS